MAIYIFGTRVSSERSVVFTIACIIFLYYMFAGTDRTADLKTEKYVWRDQSSEETNHKKFLSRLGHKSKCPDYVEYSQVRHGPFSKGKFKYPFMRPAPECRTFVSEAVDKVIEDLKMKLKDEDLGRMLENCLPNTLDTTVLWHIGDASEKQLSPQTFIVTGDIHAEWLRDSAWQLAPYQQFVRYDPKLRQMIKGAINTQIAYILNSPYCNAFHPPPGSNVMSGERSGDKVYPQPDWDQVFECKYELDSLASFLTLSNQYYANSGDASFVTNGWLEAYKRILTILRRESQPSFDPKTGYAMNFYYSFQRDTNIGSETLPLGGVGNPVNYNTGLIRSAFRPSDDACIYQFFIPANIHMLTELKNIRKNVLNTDTDLPSIPKDTSLDKLIESTDGFIQGLEEGIRKYGIVDHPKFGKVYAYEVDGYGSSLIMDDANLPSLLSMPDLGFLDPSDEIYQDTRKMILSKDGNPYYLKGKHFEAVGGPHIDIHHAWPMSLLVGIRTSTDDEEIVRNLKAVMETTAGLGLLHESVHVHSMDGMKYTRSWFAWGNSEFGRTILYLAKHKPHLIFKDEYATSYDIGSVLPRL